MRTIYAGLLLALWAFAGCQTSPEPLATQGGHSTLANGALNFSTIEDYDNFLNSSPEEIEAFVAERAREGFVSYAEAHLTDDLELVEKDDEEPLVDSYLFSRIVNQDGVVK